MATDTKSPPRKPSNAVNSIDKGTYQAWLQRQAELDSIGKLFVVGCYKSGTTWLQRSLDHHPEMVVKGEGCAAWKLVPMLNHALNEYNKHQATYGHGQFTCIQNADCLAMYRAAINAQLGGYIKHSGHSIEQVRVVGDKTPQHAVCMSILSSVFPAARFIHIIRDPRDAAVSSWFHGDPLRFGSSIEEHTEAFLRNNWPVNVRNALASGDALGSDRYCEVRYEDLLADSEAELRRLFSFCGVDDSEHIAAACGEACSFKSITKGRDNGEEEAGNFFRKGIAGDWRNHLDPEDIAPQCAPIRDLMDRYGYKV